MRESIQVETIRCERCVSKIAGALAPIKGIHEARIELGTSSVIVDYDDAARQAVTSALEDAGFDIIARSELAPA